MICNIVQKPTQYATFSTQQSTTIYLHRLGYLGLYRSIYTPRIVFTKV